MKYLIIKKNGYEEIIVFPATIAHKEMARLAPDVMAAGFIHFPENGDRPVCFGHSESLNIDSRGTVDADVFWLQNRFAGAGLP